MRFVLYTYPLGHKKHNKFNQNLIGQLKFHVDDVKGTVYQGNNFVGANV